MKDLKESQDAQLALARSLDLTFSPWWQADQEGASTAYEQYLSDHPRSELAPYIYYHLGRMFTGANNSRKKRSGFRKDYKRANYFFKKAINSYPDGKISWLLCRTRICFASIGSSDTEKIKRYAECCIWLDSLDRRLVSRHLWLPSDVSEAQKNAEITTFLKNRSLALGVASHNMMSTAENLDSSEVPTAMAALSDLPAEMPLIETLRKRLSRRTSANE